MAWVVEYFTDVARRSPFQQWRADLSALASTAVDVKIEYDIRPDGPGAAGSMDHGDGLYSTAVHFGGVRLRVYYTADRTTSTVWLLHGYDVAADPGTERLARQAAETVIARQILGRWQLQRQAR